MNKDNAGFLRGFLILFAWFICRALDFWSDSVPYSHLRLLIVLLLPISFLTPIRYIIPFRLNESLSKIGGDLERVFSRKSTIVAALFVLSLIGYGLFYSRYQRGANLGDFVAFRQSVETTARFSGLLYNDAIPRSQLLGHSNLFLFLFVPFVWIFGKSWFLIMQYVESLVIVGYCYMVGYAVGTLIGKKLWIWILTAGLFLATYRHHMIFHDTEFAALGLAMFVAGIVLEKRSIYLIGFVCSLLTRETAVLSIVGMLFILPKRAILTKDRWVFMLIGVVYLTIFTVATFQWGGIAQLARFDTRIFHPEISISYLETIWVNFINDCPLKLAYTVRVLSFCPTVLLCPTAWGGMISDLLFTWLSRDYVFYRISRDYYVPILPIVIIFGFYVAKSHSESKKLHTILLKWSLMVCLWQFLTTFHPRLF